MSLNRASRVVIRAMAKAETSTSNFGAYFTVLPNQCLAPRLRVQM